MGRAELCGPSGFIAGGVSPTVLFAGLEPKARSKGQVVVALKDCKFRRGVYANLIESVVVEETTGFMMSMAKVVLTNPNFDITDDDVWEEGAEMTIETGFSTTGLVRRHGKFFLTTPKFSFGDSPKITLIAFGEEIKLGRTERRRVFRKQTDSEIAEQIAIEHGFGIDIESTKQVHEQVIQANENDYKFLCRRALLHGFMLYLEGGILHFHKARPVDSKIRLVRRGGQDSSLAHIEVQTQTFMRGAQYTVSQVDPLRLEVFSHTSTDDLDEVTRALIQDVRSPRKWDDIVTNDEERPMKFLVNVGHEQEIGPLKEQVQAVAESDRWVVQGKGRTFGLEQMRPNELIDIVGIGKHSGKYYLTKVRHIVTGGVYRVEFDVARSFTGGLAGNRCESDVVQPVRAGVVNLAG